MTKPRHDAPVTITILSNDQGFVPTNRQKSTVRLAIERIPVGGSAVFDKKHTSYELRKVADRLSRGTRKLRFSIRTQSDNSVVVHRHA